MKIFLVMILSVPTVFAMECGRYKISGKARMVQNMPFIVVNERTSSEYLISISLEEEPKLAPYIDQPIQLTATIDTKMDGRKGKAHGLNEVALRVPQPLAVRPDTGFLLLSKNRCQK